LRAQPGSAMTAVAPSPVAAATQEIELSIVMPCLNEAETLATCITKALGALEREGIAGEVIVADNGSTDGSQAIAEKLGAVVVHVPAKGYGSALQGGIAAARGRYVIMGDADDSYDFGAIGVFVAKLRQGYDLVMGNRFKGGIRPGAMPFLNRYLGNPVLTGIGRLLFQSPCGDFHCGLRAFSKASVTRMNLRTTGMEFASEMVVKATLFGLRIAEVPTTLSPDGRTRPPHLRPWRDGWRHLRFLFLYSPRWLFLIPGLALMAAGVLVGAWLVPGPRVVRGVTLDVHTLFYAGLAVILGAQAVFFHLFTKVFAISEGLMPSDPRLDSLFERVTLESGLLIGSATVLVGLAGSLWAVGAWGRTGFGQVDYAALLRIVIPSGTALALGCQTIFASFFLSVLGLRRR
jgi:glycosyltransferase involved in cell wall biosynthesis